MQLTLNSKLRLVLLLTLSLWYKTNFFYGVSSKIRYFKSKTHELALEKKTSNPLKNWGLRVKSLLMDFMQLVPLIKTVQILGFKITLALLLLFEVKNYSKFIRNLYRLPLASKALDKSKIFIQSINQLLTMLFYTSNFSIINEEHELELLYHHKPVLTHLKNNLLWVSQSIKDLF